MKKNNKILIIFMLISFCIVVLETLNSFYVVKSIEIFETINSEMNITFDEYINLQLINYFSSVVLYIIFTLYNYFLWNKLKINILYKGIFSLFILSNVLFKIFVYAQYTIYSILSIIVQIILLLLVIFVQKGNDYYE